MMLTRLDDTIDEHDDDDTVCTQGTESGHLQPLP